VIRREQLVAAIRRIDAPERELLWLSLLRRVPDAALGRLQGCEPREVARRRAAAIERVADELGVQRGEDFGAVLTGLLEAETWVDVAPETTIAAPPAPAVTDKAPATHAEPPPPEPRKQQLPGVSSSASARRSRRSALRPWAVGAALVTLAIVILVVAVAGGDDGGRATPRGASFVPRQGSSGGQALEGAGAPCYFTASVQHPTDLYRRPGGRTRARLGVRTRWGSPQVLHVVVRRAAWLGVIAPQLRNGELGWLPVRGARVGCVRWSLEADLSGRRLEARRDDRLVRTITVAIGPRHAQTPTGRFAVTDRLEVNGHSPYGCCVLALSGHQGQPRSRGGDRLAVYAQSSGAAAGETLSRGALRVPSVDARWLIDNIPLGTPILIRP
jgi:hypothetical protein